MAKWKKFCICGHDVYTHHKSDGCTAIVEGSDCEDHWVCRCMCTVCMHLAQLHSRKNLSCKGPQIIRVPPPDVKKKKRENKE